jgi:amidohydrolase
MIELAGLAELVADELRGAVELRHLLHADPRLSGQEDDTAEQVLAALAAPGPLGALAPLEPAPRVAGTGRLLRIGPPTGPAVALRAELDGLPTTEATGLPYAATGDVMHACGHDLHMAALVAVARGLRRYLVERPLPCALLVLLQPREETSPSGAADVLGDPGFAVHDVRAVIGAHVQPALPRGVISAAPGAVNASCDEFVVTVRGRGGHAAYPHRCDDPVLALSQTVVALHHLVSRRVDPLAAAALTVGRVEAGTASNVIPSVARAYGTLRALDGADRERLLVVVRRTVEHTALAYGCTGTVDVVGSEPLLRNDPRLVAELGTALAQLGAARGDPASGDLARGGALGKLQHDVTFRSCGSDDFAHYAVAGPAAMLFVGVGAGGSSDADLDEPGLHTARFAPPDEVLGELAGAYLAGFVAGMRAFVLV